MKWIWVAVLVIIGILAAIVAIEYFTVEIYKLPSWIPGHNMLIKGLYKDYAHYRKRGALAALVAIVAFAGAAVLAVRFQRAGTAPAATAPQSAGDVLAAPSPSEAPAAEPPGDDAPPSS